MGLGQCISHSQGGEAPSCGNRNSHLRRRDAWGVQGRWRGMASGRGAQRPWLRSAVSEGMQASQDFRQFSVLGGGKDLIGLAFSL